MTKTSKLAADTIIGTDAPATPAAATKPYCLTIFGPTTTVLQELAFHVRNGYTPDINSPVQVFSAAGTMSIVLVLGNPDEAFRDRAAVTVADAVALEEAAYRRDVELAAARIVENEKQAEKAAKRAELIAAQRAALAALEASA